jgi:Ras-related protein Rab-6A
MSIISISFLPSQVTLEEANAKANQMSIMFMETSAKAGHNVKSLFKKIAMSLPGMEKDTQNEANTSGFEPHAQGYLRLTVFLGIDVKSQPLGEIPEASQCNC